MPHLEGTCNCGRKIRFPKHATIGYQWTCYKCGKTWTLSTHGEPLRRAKSLPPPTNSVSSSGSSGCLILIAVPIIFFSFLTKYLLG